MTGASPEYASFLAQATGNKPYDYQKQLAVQDDLPQLVEIPTGLGKTAAVVLGWLWRRLFADKEIRAATPRRLVYCLPMKALVEQTESAVRAWLEKLGLHQEIQVHVLMSGEADDDWDLYPERDAILIGTQDMLLSRALNRGYAMSRYRWPMHFGLLNNDCLWVFDEVQLMGSGLATTAQLEAFRHTFWSPAKACRSIWMSATLQRSWLKTVDFDPEGLERLALSPTGHAADEVCRRYQAKKPLARAKHAMGDASGLAEEIRAVHRPGTRTLVVVNTVREARAVRKQIEKLFEKAEETQNLVSIHSRFRPQDRKRAVERLLEEPPEEGTIVISTQVVEAGIDVSATTLFTELAPWSSLVQRFGRCNRAGTDDRAQVFWVDLPADEKEWAKAAAPYELADLQVARGHLTQCERVGPADLPAVSLNYTHGHVLRSKDLLELFDTTPDLAGHDIDIDRYVREVEESGVRVFWRAWAGDRPDETESAPHRDELCPVPRGEFRDFLSNLRKKDLSAFRWDHLDRQWSRADPGLVSPGQTYLLPVAGGGYSPATGWDPSVAEEVIPLPIATGAAAPEDNDDDRLSESRYWESIAEHTSDVYRQAESLCQRIGPAHAVALALAARWHDRGKAHPTFQDRILKERKGSPRPAEWLGRSDLGKAPGGGDGDPGWWKPRYSRKHFRHELASALAVLLAPNELIPRDLRDLVAYLVAAHHGKVRLSIRSLPGERQPDPPTTGQGLERRFARGIWDDDALPQTDLGGQIAPAVCLSLEPMKLGECQPPPFAGHPSWAERMLRLRDTLGPFQLAFLEALLRAADIRASRKNDLLSPAQEEPDHA
jgi:CRISPR-associated endonuclease/helicase Cas3